MKLPPIFRNTQRWLFDTPERALDQAYRAALKIKAIEDEHFNGKQVSAEATDYGASVITYFQSEVDKYINTAKIRIAEFKTSNYFLRLTEATSPQNSDSSLNNGLEISEKSAIIIDKLNFIDEVINKYQNNAKSKKSLALIQVPQQRPFDSSASISSDTNKTLRQQNNEFASTKAVYRQELKNGKVETVSDKTGLLPRSILRTFSKIKQEIDPKSQEAEEEVLSKFRSSRSKTAISIKFLLMLVIIPLLTHQLTKIAITPYIESHFFTEINQINLEKSATESETSEEPGELKILETKLFINQDLEEEALVELQKFEESVHLKQLIGLIPPVSPEEMEKQIKEKATEIATEFRYRSQNALTNIFSDICSFLAFAWVLIISQREILVLKSFIDEIIYGLSDSAKAFLIILFTDMFVGFHSPHGWEIILEGVSRHLGLPENREFNFLFIATFPVILDTVLKYWIFRYLNRISPSAVATYRNMNE